MLSAIVFCEDKPQAPTGRPLAELLARTLASLVTAKVEGLLGDVRIAGPAGKDLSVLANHAGCALQEARGPHVFLLRCGRAPDAGFIEEARDFLAGNSKDRPHAAYLHALPESFAERIFPSLAPVAGLIASRDRMLSAPRGGFPKLASFVAPATVFYTRARRIR